MSEGTNLETGYQIIESRKSLGYDVIRPDDYNERKERAIMRVTENLRNVGKGENANRIERHFLSVKEKIQNSQAKTEDYASLTESLVLASLLLKHPDMKDEMGVWPETCEVRKKYNDGSITFYYHASYRDRVGDGVWDSGEIDFS